MERLKVPVPFHSNVVQRIFDNGHSVHSRIEKELTDSGVIVLAEAPVSTPEHNLYGHTDGIGKIEVPGLGGVMVILEIKSCGVNAWKFMVGSKTWPGKGPKTEHIQQVQLYMYMSGLNYAVLIYENKNTQERMYYTIKRDLQLIKEELLPKVDLVNDGVVTKSLPRRDKDHLDPQPNGKTPMECNYCNYSKVCKREEENFASNYTTDLVKLGEELLD
jgi:hypothetical protein